MNLGPAHQRRALGEVPQTAVDREPQYAEESAEYVVDVVLLANAETNVTRSIDTDSDFLWVAKCGTQTGIYEVQFFLPNGRSMSGGTRVRNANYVGTAQFPVPLRPPELLPGGSQVRVNIKDLSGAGNTIQILLIGIKQFRTHAR